MIRHKIKVLLFFFTLRLPADDREHHLKMPALRKNLVLSIGIVFCCAMVNRIDCSLFQMLLYFKRISLDTLIRASTKLVYCMRKYLNTT